MHTSFMEATKPTQVLKLLRLYQAALDSADPLKVVPRHLPLVPRGRTVVVGMGKAAAAMAAAVETNWDGNLSGVVVVPPGAAMPLRRIRCIEGSHPIPSEGSVIAAQQLMKAVEHMGTDDLVLALISGGGSSLCAMPASGLSLRDKQKITQDLLSRGATIGEINVVRKHLSAIKGGRLAEAAYPARVVTLLISDIPGDDPALIASGTTLPDPTTCADALAVLKRYVIEDFPHVNHALSASAWESIKPGAARQTRNTHQVVACARDGLLAAKHQAGTDGLECHILSDAMEGEARDLALSHAAIALSVANHNTPFNSPCVIISGGEATVTLRGKGLGGRNTEFALSLALALEGRNGASRIHALSAGTDGLDGTSCAAGAWISPTTLSEARLNGLSPRKSLDDNDSATLLNIAGALIHTGPTFTNINDFRAVLIE
jgi:glycerate 2-kinase